MSAYQRDASWYSHPDVRSPKRWHLEDEPGSAIAACSRHVLLVEATERDASTVPAPARCARPGCAKRWREVPA